MADSIRRDDRTRAIIALSWLIAANKPFYPLYVWYLTGEGVAISCLTLVAAPAYVAIALLGQSAPLAARIAFPIVALADTLAETKLFGPAAGTELFLAPAALIASHAFAPAEARWSRALILVFYAALLALHGRYGTPLHVWSDAGLASLCNLNVIAAASLTVFIVWRFAAVRA